MTIATKQTTSARVGIGIIAQPSGFIEPAFNAGNPTVKFMACALWDDSVDGHLPVAVSSSGMGLGVFLPARAMVVHDFFNVLVVPVGPTNMGLSSEADGDLIVSAGISGAPWSSTGLKHGVVVRTDSADVAFTTKVLTTAVRELQLFATVQPTSAGRVSFYVEYVVAPSSTQGAAN